jgi:hypothetical protein
MIGRSRRQVSPDPGGGHTVMGPRATRPSGVGTDLALLVEAKIRYEKGPFGRPIRRVQSNRIPRKSPQVSWATTLGTLSNMLRSGGIATALLVNGEMSLHTREVKICVFKLQED